MDNPGLGGRFLKRHQQTQLDYQSRTRYHHLKSPINIMRGFENGHSIGLVEAKDSIQRGLPLNFLGKGKGITSVMVGNNDSNGSDDDLPSYAEVGNGENLNRAKGDKGSPWHRMKWTDNVVRLLIAVVARVGDDDSLDGEVGLKRKSGVLQKKGKWKTVSKVMIAKGCYVSPQQCEDKFNDLNKRYKKLNDILGRGTSCSVVEDPSLMDSMPQLPAKMKEDVRKILSSKHLFYKEMCAYHNGKTIPNCDDVDLQVHSLALKTYSKDNNGCEEEEAQENDESDDDESDSEDNSNIGEDVERMKEYGEQKKQNEEDGSFWPPSSVLDCFESEMTEIFEDPIRSRWERREWIIKQTVQLQEQRVSIQAEALELQKRCINWQRFCSKKERELERSMLENERMKLENERMALQLKQKEFEINLKRSSASSGPGSHQIDLGRHQ